MPVATRPGRNPAPPDMTELLTVNEAATLLGVAPRSIQAAIARHAAGRHGLAATRYGARLFLIRRADLAAYAATRRPYYPKSSREPTPGQ